MLQWRPEWIQRIKQGLRGWFARTGANTDITSVHLNWLDLVEQLAVANPGTDKARLFVTDIEGITALVYRSSTGFEARVLRDQLYIVRNNSGVTLSKGTVVRNSGTSGNGPTAAVMVNRARANAASTMPAFGILAQDIAPNADGRCLQVGRIDGLNTSAFAVLDLLYVSPDTPGALTNVRPTAPNRSQPVAQVINSHASSGAITVLIGSVLNESLSTVQPSYSIGDNTAGAKQLRFLNGFTSILQVNPTAARTWTLPDRSDMLMGLLDFTNRSKLVVSGGGDCTWNPSNGQLIITQRIIVLPAGNGSKHYNVPYANTGTYPVTYSLANWDILFIRPSDAQVALATSPNGIDVAPTIQHFTAYVPQPNDIVIAMRNGENSRIVFANGDLNCRELIPWINLSLQNGWVNYAGGYATAQYRRHPSGLVEVKGLIKSGTITNATIIANLPAGYRPSARRLFTGYCANGAFQLDVTATGDIQIYSVTNNGFLSLESIVFVAEA